MQRLFRGDSVLTVLSVFFVKTIVITVFKVILFNFLAWPDSSSPFSSDLGFYQTQNDVTAS